MVMIINHHLLWMLEDIMEYGYIWDMGYGYAGLWDMCEIEMMLLAL